MAGKVTVKQLPSPYSLSTVNLALVLFHNVLDNGQTPSGTAHLAAAAFIYPVEPFKDAI
jgi:hypothetical protein